MLSFVGFFLIALSAGYVAGLGSGPPVCTLVPGHIGAHEEKSDCKDFFTFTYQPENSNALINRRKRRPEEKPDGQLVVIQAKNLNQTFKGIAIYSHQQLDMPLLPQNRDLKPLSCLSGIGRYISHKNPNPKKAVGFFFKGEKPAAANQTIFVATILESYSKYWRNCVF